MGPSEPTLTTTTPQESSGVGVIDKSALILSVLEHGPASLAELVRRSGIPRPTAHRLASALELHRLVARDLRGQFVLGPRLSELAAAAGEDSLIERGGPIVEALHSRTNESVQLYRRQGNHRICVVTAEHRSGLSDNVPLGTSLPLTGGSAAHVLLAWETPEEIAVFLPNAHFDAATLESTRRRGWSQSVAEREFGVASVSAPVRGPSGRVVGALCISGPVQRLTWQPGRLFSAHVLKSATQLTRQLQQ